MRDFTDEEYEAISPEQAFKYCILTYLLEQRLIVATMLRGGASPEWIANHDRGRIPRNVKRVMIKALTYYQDCLLAPVRAAHNN